MSTRDRGLLEAAGLSMVDAAKLLNVTRQALYSGLSNSRHYFSRNDAMAVLHDAKFRKTDHIDHVVDFIRANYPAPDSDLILLDDLGYKDLIAAIDEAETVIFIYNGHVGHLDRSAPFAEALIRTADTSRPFGLFVSGLWVAGYILQHFNVRITEAIVRDEAAYSSCYVLLKKRDAVRAFVFVRKVVDEMDSSEALQLWKHYAPMYQVSADDTLQLLA